MPFPTFWNPGTGGCLNLLGGPVGTNRCGMTIGGGEFNTVTGPYSTVVGGCLNNVSGQCSSILGGCGNTVTHDYAAAFGFNLTSCAPNTFHVECLNANSMPSIPVGGGVPALPVGTLYFMACVGANKPVFIR